MLALRADLQRSGMRQHEDANVCDILPYFERLRIAVTLSFAEEDRPEFAIERQRFESLRIGCIELIMTACNLFAAVNNAWASISRGDEVVLATRA